MGLDYLLHYVFGSVYGLSFNFNKKGVTIVCFILPLPIETVPGKLYRKRNFRKANSAAHSKGWKQIILLTGTGTERFWTFPIIPQTCMHCSPSRKEMEARLDQWYSINSWTVSPEIKTKPQGNHQEVPQKQCYTCNAQMHQWNIW